MKISLEIVFLFYVLRLGINTSVFSWQADSSASTFFQYKKISIDNRLSAVQLGSFFHAQIYHFKVWG